ncbi:MAG: bifunctional DNA-formamidopyrimidine glycosylase/DNA-(apurinic or apyrimidinic site) lyase [Dehalococcoidia bacterium]
MPELPEVETTRRDLDARLRGRTILAVCFDSTGVTPARGLGPVEMADALRGRRIERLSRRGKYLIAHLDGGDALVLHRRMTGNLVLRRQSDPPEPYTRAVLTLDDGNELRWTDQRRFGTWMLTDTPEQAIPTIGPEPLEDGWLAEHLASALANRTAPIKAVLLDQRRVAGLGNIYADESLHLAGIHPERPAGTLTVEEVQRLHEAVRQVLELAIQLQGSSASSYVGGLGQRGSMQDEWRAYQRTGEPCRTCGTPIERIRVGGRGTHFCPQCQPSWSEAVRVNGGGGDGDAIA